MHSPPFARSLRHSRSPGDPIAPPKSIHLNAAANSDDGLLIEHHSALVYPTQDHFALRHSKYIQQDVIDKIFIARRYESLKGLAVVFRRLKRIPPLDPLPGQSLDLCSRIWDPALPDIVRWINTVRGPVVVCPVPSGSGLSERFAEFLTKRLVGMGLPVFSQLVLGRAVPGLAIKAIYDWRDRLAATERMFVLHHRPIAASALLVDDVTASGSCLRACARLLREAGSRKVAAAVASADLTTYIARYAKSG